MNKKRGKNKRAVSLMLSYVLLVVISMALAVGVYSWLKFIAKGPEEIKKCPESMSLIIQDYECIGGGRIRLDIKNKGLFNADGYAIRGTNNKSQEAWFKLIDVMGMGAGGREGIYLLLDPLQPNNVDEHSFSYEGLGKLEKIEIEPIRIIGKEMILCENAVISQEINCTS